MDEAEVPVRQIEKIALALLDQNPNRSDVGPPRLFYDAVQAYRDGHSSPADLVEAAIQHEARYRAAYGSMRIVSMTGELFTAVRGMQKEGHDARVCPDA